MNEVTALREREKELRCLYRVGEIVSRRDQGIEEAFAQVLSVVPDGWRRPERTGCRIRFFGRDYVGVRFDPKAPLATEPLRLWGLPVGSIEVSHRDGDLDEGEAAFLDDEFVLLRNLAARLGDFLEWKQTELLGMRVPARTEHWRWREDQARALAAAIDTARFPVEEIYLGGSTHHGVAGPASDIDLYIVYRGDEDQRAEFSAWLTGWSACLGQIAYRQTGYDFTTGLFDVHWLDDEPGVWSRMAMKKLPLRSPRD